MYLTVPESHLPIKTRRPGGSPSSVSELCLAKLTNVLVLNLSSSIRRSPADKIIDSSSTLPSMASNCLHFWKVSEVKRKWRCGRWRLDMVEGVTQSTGEIGQLHNVVQTEDMLFLLSTPLLPGFSLTLAFGFDPT